MLSGEPARRRRAVDAGRRRTEDADGSGGREPPGPHRWWCPASTATRNRGVTSASENNPSAPQARPPERSGAQGPRERRRWGVRRGEAPRAMEPGRATEPAASPAASGAGNGAPRASVRGVRRGEVPRLMGSPRPSDRAPRASHTNGAAGDAASEWAVGESGGATPPDKRPRRSERARRSEPRERSEPAKRRASEACRGVRRGDAPGYGYRQRSERSEASQTNGASRRSGERVRLSGSPRGDAPRSTWSGG